MNDLFQVQAEPSSDLLVRLVSRAAILEAEQREPSGACMRANNSCCRPILFVYTWLYFGEGPHGCSFGGRPHGIFFPHACQWQRHQRRARMSAPLNSPGKDDRADRAPRDTFRGMCAVPHPFPIYSKDRSVRAASGLAAPARAMQVVVAAACTGAVV